MFQLRQNLLPNFSRDPPYLGYQGRFGGTLGINYGILGASFGWVLICSTDLIPVGDTTNLLIRNESSNKDYIVMLI